MICHIFTTFLNTYKWYVILWHSKQGQPIVLDDDDDDDEEEDPHVLEKTEYKVPE